jgi:hypothetical protein
VCQKGRTPKKVHNLGSSWNMKKFFLFGFGLSLTRKSFWKSQLNYLPIKLNDPVIDVGT